MTPITDKIACYVFGGTAVLGFINMHGALDGITFPGYYLLIAAAVFGVCRAWELYW